MAAVCSGSHRTWWRLTRLHCQTTDTTKGFSSCSEVVRSQFQMASSGTISRNQQQEPSAGTISRNQQPSQRGNVGLNKLNHWTIPCSAFILKVVKVAVSPGDRRAKVREGAELVLTFRFDKITTKRCEPAETHRKTQQDHKNPNETRQQTQNQKNDRQVNRRQQINCDKQKKEQSHQIRRTRGRQRTAAEVHEHIVHNSHTTCPDKSSCTQTHTGSVADPTWPPSPPPHLFVIKAGGNLLHFLFHTFSDVLQPI